jgi:hypothetical protein
MPPRVRSAQRESLLLKLQIVKLFERRSLQRPPDAPPGTIPRWVSLDVPFEEKDEVKALGAVWDARARSWYTSSDSLERFEKWLPSSLVGLGPRIGPPVEIALLGLPWECWRCQTTGIALVGMMEPDGDICGENLVLCDCDYALRLADRILPDQARVNCGVGAVRRRYSKTVGEAYLSNGCRSCSAIVGAFPLFHEAVPEALAAGGAGGLLPLATVAVPESWWLRALASHWQ